MNSSGAGTPIPNVNVERLSKGSSDVTSYFLSEAELEDVRNKYPKPKKPQKGAPYKMPGELKNLTKEQYLAERIAGKSRTQIQKEYFSNPYPFYTKLGEWGIRELSVEQEVIAEMNKKEPGANEDPSTPVEEPSIESTDFPGGEKSEGAEDKGISIAYEEESSTTTQDDRAENIRFLTIRIPLYDVGADPITQRNKCHEELDEVSTEFEASKMDSRRAAGELFDLIQSFAGYVRAQLQELLSEEIVDRYLEDFFDRHNAQHIEKLKGYAAERGWRTITE